MAAAFIKAKIDLLSLMEGKSLYTVYKAADSVKENSGEKISKLHELQTTLTECTAPGKTPCFADIILVGVAGYPENLAWPENTGITNLITIRLVNQRPER